MPEEIFYIKEEWVLSFTSLDVLSDLYAIILHNQNLIFLK